MIEEKKTVNKIQLTVSDTMKMELEERAEKLGVPVTQYIMTLVINDMRKPLKEN